MWGTLFIPLFAYLIYLLRKRAPANWRAGVFTALGLVLVLLAVMFALGFIGLKLKPDLINGILTAQGLNVGVFIADSVARRLAYIGGLLTMLALLIPTLSFLFHSKNDSEDQSSTFNIQHSTFILLLVVLGSLLIIGPDFVYLSDNFGYRINTVFKFYYQAWIILSIASAYGTVVLLRQLHRVANVIFSVIIILVMIVGLTYPVFGFITKTNGFNPPFDYTLDDFDRVQRENPDEAAAMLWLRSAPDGIIAEAVGGAYSAYARISIYTGLPTVLGWGNHEGQWRNFALQGSREQDIATLYTTPDWNTTHDIIVRYNIRYIYIGSLERTTYHVNEEKFKLFLKPVFQQGIVTIYEVP